MVVNFPDLSGPEDNFGGDMELKILHGGKNRKRDGNGNDQGG